jgi:hypothetical protein
MNKNFSDIIERMKRAGGLKNDTAVASKLGVTPQAISNYRKKGKMPPSLVIRFAELYGLSVDWLLTGRGRMKRTESTPEGDLPAPGRPGVSTDQRTSGEDALWAPSFSPLSPDEIIYIGKLLKVLRGAGKSDAENLKFVMDAFSKLAYRS